MTLLRWLVFLLGSKTDSHSPTLLDLFLSSEASICSTMDFPPLENSDHGVVSVSIDFPSFHCIAYDYSQADWDNLHDHLRDVPWEDIFKSQRKTLQILIYVSDWLYFTQCLTSFFH